MPLLFTNTNTFTGRVHHIFSKLCLTHITRRMQTVLKTRVLVQRGLCVCLSVCLSVCVSHTLPAVIKRLNQPTEMPFGGKRKEPWIRRGAYGRHLATTTFKPHVSVLSTA